MTGQRSRLDALADHYDETDTSAALASATAVEADAPDVSDRMATFAVRLPVPVLEQIRQVAGERGTTTSAVIRSWIDAGIVRQTEGASGVDERAVPVAALLELISRIPRGHAATRLDRTAVRLPPEPPPPPLPPLPPLSDVMASREPTPDRR